MTKKHLIAFAKIAKGHADAQNLAASRAIYYAVCQVNDNPLFNREKFLKACGLDMEKLGGKP